VSRSSSHFLILQKKKDFYKSSKESGKPEEDLLLFLSPHPSTSLNPFQISSNAFSRSLIFLLKDLPNYLAATLGAQSRSEDPTRNLWNPTNVKKIVKSLKFLLAHPHFVWSSRLLSSTVILLVVFVVTVQRAHWGDWGPFPSCPKRLLSLFKGSSFGNEVY